MRHICCLLTLLVFCASAAAREPVALDSIYRGYEAAEAGSLAPSEEGNVRALLASPEASWPTEVLDRLESRIAAEWDPSLDYGVVRAGVGATLVYPLVTARLGEEIVVPVVESFELPVLGELDPLSGLDRRRVALLVDTSASTRQLPRFDPPATAPPWQSAWHALDRVFGHAASRGLESSLVAYGGRARLIVEPGTPGSLAVARIARERQARLRRRSVTDAACALWVGQDALEDAPPDYETHLVLVTDGGAPRSGRFRDCASARRFGGAAAEWVCKRVRNDSTCPASHTFQLEDGRSDWDQIEHFSAQLPERVRVHTVLLGPGPDAERYLELARRTGGTADRVVGRDSVLQVLEQAIGYRARSVVALNETTGRNTRNLLASDGLRFEGSLPLSEGANDVLLRIERDDGELTTYRFRVYAEPGLRRDYLDDLDEKVRELERRRSRLLRETARAMRGGSPRTLELRAE